MLRVFSSSDKEDKYPCLRSDYVLDGKFRQYHPVFKDDVFLPKRQVDELNFKDLNFSAKVVLNGVLLYSAYKCYVGQFRRRII